MENWLIFLIAVLAVWRVTHLIAYEDGPWNLVARARAAAGASWVGDLMDCFKCLSLWVAIPFVFVLDAGWAIRAVAWLALSGAAIILDEHFTDPIIIEGDQDDGMLRRPESEDGMGSGD